MLDPAELKLLSKWCRARSLHWQPGVTDEGQPALLLEGAPREALTLLPADDEWRLLDRDGQMLAASSGLTELLDAVDGGVGEDALAPMPAIRLAPVPGETELLLA